MAADAPRQSGHQMGRIMAHLVTNVVRDTRAAVAPAEAEMKRRSVNGMMDEWEVALGARLGEAIGDIDFGEDTPAFIDLLQELASEPKNSIDLFLQIVLFLPLALSGMGTAANIAFGEMFNQMRARYTTVPLDPGVAAGLVATGKIPLASGINEAQFSSVNSDRFTTMVRAAQGALPLSSLLELFRRRLISDGELHRGMTENALDGNWQDVAEHLAYSLPGPGVYVEALIKGVLSVEEARAGYVAAGGEVSTFPVVYNSSGSAIGVVEAGRLFTHGLISEADYRAVIKYSHVNPRFEAMAAMQHKHWLTAFQVHQLAKNGDITPELAAKWLIEDGYDAEQVAALSHGAHKEKVAPTRTATKDLITTTYEAGFMTQDDAIAQLTTIGYDGDEARLILMGYDAKRTLAAMNGAVTRVRAAFIARRITRIEASADLDAVGVHFAVRDHLLADWDVELSTAFKTLSQAQVGSLVKKGIITPDEGARRWEAMGYTSADSALMVADHEGTLSAAMVGSLLKASILTAEEAGDRWRTMGYQSGDVDLLTAKYGGVVT